MAEFEALVGQNTVATETVSDFSHLLNKNKAEEITAKFDAYMKDDQEAIKSALDVFFAQIGQNSSLVLKDKKALDTIDAYINAIDEKLNLQINAILHHKDFQALEASWRGLALLVNQPAATDSEIRVMDIAKSELEVILLDSEFQGEGNFENSPLYKKIYDEGLGTTNQAPFGCLIGDYYFDYSIKDTKVLTEIARIAAAANAPFIASASPTLFGARSWLEFAGGQNIPEYKDNHYIRWNAFRESEDSRYVGLTAPRFVARQPYGEYGEPVRDGFPFEEVTQTHQDYCWSNATYAMGVNINRSFRLHGWCSRISGFESGGNLEGLAKLQFPTADGNTDSKCPIEISLTNKQTEMLSAKRGLIPLEYRENSDKATFIGAQSVQKPQEYMDVNATESAQLSANLSYLFAVSRFAHYLKAMVRDKVGSYTNREEMERNLTNWINHYVDGNPMHSSAEDKARTPLAAAKVVVEDVAGNPGVYTARFELVPHFQLKRLDIALSLVSKLQPKG